MAIADKLTYLDDTKQLIRGGLEAVGEYITDDTPFREYVTKLANSQRTLGSNFAGDSYDLLSPVNDLDFEDVYTLTRGSDGAFWNRHGILSTAGMDVKRVNHDPATLNSSADTFDLATLSRWDVVVVNLGSANTYGEGQVVAVSDDADLNNCFYAEIKSIDADALTCHVAHVQGSGSISAWTIIKSEGLLIEEQRTNSLLHNRDLSQAAWTSDGTPTINQNETGIDGTANTAWTVTDDDAGVFEGKVQVVTVSDDSNTHTVSLYLKKTTGASSFPGVGFLLSGGTALRYQVTMDTDAGTAVARDVADSLSVDVEDSGDYWRVIVSGANNGTGNTSMTYQIYPAVNADASSLWDATTTGSCVYDYGQVELNATFTTTPILTTSAQVTRSADNCSRTLGSEFNEDECTWVVEYNYFGDSVNGLFYIFDVAVGNNRVNLLDQQVLVQFDGATVTTGYPKTIGQDNKIALSISSSKYIVSKNGVTQTEEQISGSPLIAGGTLRLGQRYTQVNYGNGTLKIIKFIPRALSATELEALTS